MKGFPLELPSSAKQSNPSLPEVIENGKQVVRPDVLGVVAQLATLGQLVQIRRCLDDGTPQGNLEHQGKEKAKIRIREIPFSYDLAPLEGVQITEIAPSSGYIRQVCPHWPDGCNALVDVRVGTDVKQFCPATGYLALNDAMPTYPFNEPVGRDDAIWVEMRNADAQNSHLITVTIILEEAAWEK